MNEEKRNNSIAFGTDISIRQLYELVILHGILSGNGFSCAASQSPIIVDYTVKLANEMLERTIGVK